MRWHVVNRQSLLGVSDVHFKMVQDIEAYTWKAQLELDKHLHDHGGRKNLGAHRARPERYIVLLVLEV